MRSERHVAARTMFASAKKMHVDAKKTRASVKKMHDYVMKLHVSAKRPLASAKRLLPRERLSVQQLAKHAMPNEHRASKLDLMSLTWTRQMLRTPLKKPHWHLSVNSQAAIAVKAIEAKVTAKADATSVGVDVAVVGAAVIVMMMHQRMEMVAAIVKADAMLRETMLRMLHPWRALKAMLAKKVPKAEKVPKELNAAKAAKVARAEKADRASAVVVVVVAVAGAAAIGRKAPRAQHRAKAARQQPAIALNQVQHLHQAEDAHRVSHANRVNRVNHVAVEARANRANHVNREATANRAPSAPHVTMRPLHQHSHRLRVQQTPLQTPHWAPQRRPFVASLVGCAD